MPVLFWAAVTLRPTRSRHLFGRSVEIPVAIVPRPRRTEEAPPNRVLQGIHLSYRNDVPYALSGH